MTYYVALAFAVIAAAAATIGGPPMFRKIGRAIAGVAARWKTPDGLPKPQRYKLTIAEFCAYWNGLTPQQRAKFDARLYVYRTSPWPEPEPTMLKLTVETDPAAQLSKDIIVAHLGPGSFTMRIDQTIGEGSDKHKAEVCLATGDVAAIAAPGDDKPRPRIYGQPAPGKPAYGSPAERPRR